MRHVKRITFNRNGVVIEEYQEGTFAIRRSIAGSLESANRQVMPTPTLVSQYDNRSFRPTHCTGRVLDYSRSPKIQLSVYFTIFEITNKCLPQIKVKSHKLKYKKSDDKI